MGRKGLSADGKRDAILNIYHTSMDPLNLKEIENIASKAGVVQQTVSSHCASVAASWTQLLNWMLNKITNLICLLIYALSSLASCYATGEGTQPEPSR
jgi:hypothetical protein